MSPSVEAPFSLKTLSSGKSNFVSQRSFAMTVLLGKITVVGGGVAKSPFPVTLPSLVQLPSSENLPSIGLSTVTAIGENVSSAKLPSQLMYRPQQCNNCLLLLSRRPAWHSCPSWPNHPLDVALLGYAAVLGQLVLLCQSCHPQRNRLPRQSRRWRHFPHPAGRH